MADRTGIEWTDASWNPVVGCSLVSPGCTNCYAMSQAARIVRCSAGLERASTYDGTVETVKGKPVWTGKVALASDATLTQPLRWKRPRRIFVNSMGDLFHEDVPDAWIDRVFAVMALAPQHTFQILTKRSARMQAYVNNMPNRDDLIARALSTAPGKQCLGDARDEVMRRVRMPLPNVWLGISAEDQRRWNERIGDLKATPAAIRFVSAEPLLSAIMGDMTGLDWVIVGGESGKGARPMHPDWARAIRDQCAAAGTAFFFKQWGQWGQCGTFQTMADGPYRPGNLVEEPAVTGLYRAISAVEGRVAHGSTLERVGKSKAGRLLDGVTHDAMPEVRHG